MKGLDLSTAVTCAAERSFNVICAARFVRTFILQNNVQSGETSFETMDRNVCLSVLLPEVKI